MGKGQSFKLVVFLIIFSVSLVFFDIAMQILGRTVKMELIYTFCGMSLFGGLANYIGRTYVENKYCNNNDNDSNNDSL